VTRDEQIKLMVEAPQRHEATVARLLKIAEVRAVIRAMHARFKAQR
jgi:hypothetical protein